MQRVNVQAATPSDSVVCDSVGRGADGGSSAAGMQLPGSEPQALERQEPGTRGSSLDGPGPSSKPSSRNQHRGGDCYNSSNQPARSTLVQAWASVQNGTVDASVGGPGGLKRMPSVAERSCLDCALDAALAGDVDAAGPTAPITISDTMGVMGERPSPASACVGSTSYLRQGLSNAFSNVSGGFMATPTSQNSGRSLSRLNSNGMGGETWLIMEFCDKGSLQDAIDMQLFKRKSSSAHSATPGLGAASPPAGSTAAGAAPALVAGGRPASNTGSSHSNSAASSLPDLPAALVTAHEIASALQYLHQRGIVHGDLTAWNVLLASSDSDAAYLGKRGFVAKVADFGLSRTMDMASKIKTRTYGTITHMAPEVLCSGIISRSADVYSFGVLLYQLYTGARPWAGMNHGQIIFTVGMKRVGLTFPSTTPPDLHKLAMKCLAQEPNDRPSFDDIVVVLSAMLSRLPLGVTIPVAPSSAATAPSWDLDSTRERAVALIAPANGKSSSGVTSLAGVSEGGSTPSRDDAVATTFTAAAAI